jgi:hypothetical protein
MSSSVKTKQMMVDRINDISWQARQGSVAAIIQVLNEKLATSGVRIRAVFDDGILQLLCEARTADRLDQAALIKQIQQILEAIAPRNIHRITISSRIVREQQLLWLDEINRDPENQLLWSEEITLAKPSLFKQLIQDITESQAEPALSISKNNSLLTPTSTFRNQLSQGIIWLVSILVFFVAIGSSVYIFLNQQTKPALEIPTTNNNQNAIKQDPFAEAVRIANQASEIGKNANTSGQWLDLAARWQRASDLMNSVPSNHTRYREAQIRTKLYKKYSDEALSKADSY